MLNFMQVKTWFQNRRAKWRRLKQVRSGMHKNTFLRLFRADVVPELTHITYVRQTAALNGFHDGF
jgi:Homeodomain